MFCSNLKPQAIEFSIKHTYSTSARRSQKDWQCKSRGMTINVLVSKQGEKALTIWDTNSLLLFNGRMQPKSHHDWAQDAKFPMAVVVKTNLTNNKCTQSSIIKVHNQCTSSNLPFIVFNKYGQSRKSLKPLGDLPL